MQLNHSVLTLYSAPPSLTLHTISNTSVLGPYLSFVYVQLFHTIFV